MRQGIAGPGELQIDLVPVKDKLVVLGLALLADQRDALTPAMPSRFVHLLTRGLRY
jgi:hypothetical protein